MASPLISELFVACAASTSTGTKAAKTQLNSSYLGINKRFISWEMEQIRSIRLTRVELRGMERRNCEKTSKRDGITPSEELVDPFPSVKDTFAICTSRGGK